MSFGINLSFRGTPDCAETMAGHVIAIRIGREPESANAMFRAAFETAGHGMAIVALDGRFIEVNDAFSRIVGYEPRELQQLDFAAITHPEDLETDMAHVRRLIEGGSLSYEMEKRYIHKRGRVVWVQLNVALIRGEDGAPRCFVAQVQDITDRKLAEEGLRRSEDRFRSLVGNLPGVVSRFTLSPEGDIRDSYVSPQVARMLGIAPDALAREALRLLDFAHPDDRGRMAAEIRRCGAELRPGTIDVRQITRPDGEIRWWRLHMTPVRLEGGAVELDSIALDITEHKAAEDRLRLHEQAFDSISQAVTIADAATPDYPVIYVNPAFERMTGYRRAEVIGRNCRFLQGTASDPAVIARIRADLHAGRSFHGEIVNHRKDGATFVNELSITPVRDPRGRITHFVGVMNDVTQRRSLEAQLRQALKIEAVGKLTGGVAHDFNNLLMVAHGNLELLSEALAAGESNVGEFVEQAQKAVLRGAELTRRLLAFARLQPLRAACVDLNQLIAELVPMLRRTLSENIQIGTALAEGLWPVTVDRSQMENALLNLAVNARDAMPDGGRLTITTANLFVARDSLSGLGPGDYVRVSVIDTGGGMPADVAERAFEPFFTTKETGKGTGLGLSMVYGFARQSGGHATLDSVLGQGTTVSLYLPRAAVPGPSAADAKAGAIISFGSERILLVEDDASVRGTVRLMLEDFGYQVIEVGDGDAGLEVLRAGREVDLVLTDLVMPGRLSGWQLAVEIWRDRPQQKVLFSTGYSESSLIPQSGRDSRLRLLRKPFGRKELAAAVRATLDDAPA